MNFLFLMDPLETVDVHKDTSFAFMLGAQRRKHRIFYVPSGGVSLCEGQVSFEAEPVMPRKDATTPFDRGRPQRLDDRDADVVFIRTDPPFDERYLMNTWLLDHLCDGAVVINSPHGLRTVNEKLWATRFTDLVPPTLVTSRLDLFKSFLTEHEKVIAKPTDGHGGVGVFYVECGDTNSQVIFEMLTHHGKKEIIIQPYLPEAQAGDKRIVLLDGEPLGAVIRVHPTGEHRNNFFAGGKPHPAEIVPHDQKIIDTLKPHLRSLGLHFVGIDVIGPYLIEVNVTSPTCVQEINHLNHTRIEDRVIAYAEALVEKRRAVT